VSPRERPAPPVAEEIHLPDPTIKPLLVAVGITVGLIGLTTNIILTVVGGVLALAVIVRWIADVRRDIDELPPAQ
jgi:hypothetical protein